MNIINNLPNSIKTILAGSDASDWSGKLTKAFEKPKKLVKAQMTLLHAIVTRGDWKNNPKLYNVASHMLKKAYRNPNDAIRKKFSHARKIIRREFKQFEVKKMKDHFKNEKTSKNHTLNHRNTKRVDYHNKKEKAHSWVYFHNNGKAKSHNGTYLYAIDRYGQMHTAKEKVHGKVRTKHSTLFAGRSVAGAGEITFSKEGKIKKINNNSGHYRPDKKEMRNTLTAIKRHGVDLSKIAVTFNKQTSKATDWKLIA